MLRLPKDEAARSGHREGWVCAEQRDGLGLGCAGFLQAGVCTLSAAPAGTGDARALVQITHGARPVSNRLGDIAVSYSMADTDVHRASQQNLDQNCCHGNATHSQLQVDRTFMLTRLCAVTNSL